MSFSISLELALNVFALSDISVEGNPHLSEIHGMLVRMNLRPDHM